MCLKKTIIVFMQNILRMATTLSIPVTAEMAREGA